MQKLTYILVLLVLSTLAFSSLRHRDVFRSGVVTQKDPDHHKRVNERFPTTDFDEADLPDAEKNTRKREKQKRYNDGNVVFSSPQPWQLESVFTPEPHSSLPALPVTESSIVVVGTVSGGQAHLSESKKNVFSEFSLVVELVLKSNVAGVNQGSVLTIDRIGGHVKYPNGQKVLFRIAGMNMPQVGARYLFFLTSKHDKADLSILTGYELTSNGVVPLDESSQFASVAGITEADIIHRVHNLIRRASN